MPATLRRLMRQRPLHLELANRGRSVEEPIQWVYGSDLADPTPFLTGGEMLLTTGTQFPEGAEAASYDAYVSRLVDRGVVALGFGTEVIRSGTPTELLDACIAHGLPLVEVPRDTPFIAIIRWAADIIAHDARARDEWAFAAQRAISLAALGRGGLGDVLSALADQLSCRVALFDLDAELDPAVTRDTFTAEELHGLRGETRRLLRAAGRSSGSLTIGSRRATLQTLGQSGHLRGVLALLGDGEHDLATRAVITGAVALAEVALEQRQIRRGSLLALHTEALALMLEGHSASVARALPDIPTDRIRAVLVHIDPEGESLEDALERRSRHLDGRLLVALHHGELAILVDERNWPDLATFLDDHEAAAGISDVSSIDDLSAGLSQARRALAHARAVGGGIVEFSHLRRNSVTGMLPSSDAPDIAAARLSALLADEAGRELLRCASVWLSHNGLWKPAATRLGLHRHSLKSRIDRVGEALDLTLSTFADRAELWMMLTALDLDAPS